MKQNRRPPTPIYYVEKIVDVREKDGVKEYFVKWKDFDASQNTWEKTDNLNPILVDDFEKRAEHGAQHKFMSGRRPYALGERPLGSSRWQRSP